ncbi:unnamed protein product [Prorocentrum cordatum]|uniref:AFG1-like ATPase n=1 Tax=Prorocentrum cordatum TaxID=2364126 RepID=A0ABN9WAI4_9DINO|nr:unnamed protein product [Polarella glacialis]
MRQWLRRRAPRNWQCPAPAGAARPVLRWQQASLRGTAYQSGPLSRLAAAVAGRLAGGPPKQSRPPPRAQTAVASAARDAGRGAQGHAYTPVSPWREAHAAASAGRLGALPAGALAAAREGPAALHAHLAAAGRLEADPAQAHALQCLSELFARLQHPGPTGSQGRGGRGGGLYVHGSVGAGKTLLLDLFLACVRAGVPSLRACRTHVHDFLQATHAELHRARHLGSCTLDVPSPTLATSVASAAVAEDTSLSPFLVLPERWWLLGEQDDVGRRRTGMAAAWVHRSRQGAEPTSVELMGHALASRIDVLCFDEVAITTIQDCVVLAPLLRALCERGVVVVATSNRAPEDLYSGGLNRHVHVPRLVQAIREHCDVHHVDSQTDHRARLAHAAPAGWASPFLWRCPPGSLEGTRFLDERALGTGGALALALRGARLAYGRSIHALQSTCGTQARFAFQDLCCAPLSADDFSAICGQFSSIQVADVPRLRGGEHSEIQRWIWLLDHCYERHCHLVLTSAADGPEDLVDLRAVSQVVF